jgi:hypothetical protein
MKNHTPLIALTLFALSFAGCSKRSPDTASISQTNLVVTDGSNRYVTSQIVTRSTNGTPQTNLVFQVGTNHVRLANMIKRGTNAPTQKIDVTK